MNTTKLYICFDVYYDYCNEYERFAWVTDSEAQAKYWVASFDDNDTEWRTYYERNLNSNWIDL